MSDVPNKLKVGTVNDRWMAEQISDLERQLTEKDAEAERLAKELEYANERSEKLIGIKDILETRIVRLREGLRRLEWCAGPVAGRPCCGVCGQRDKDGHKPDCWLDALIKVKG